MSNWANRTKATLSAVDASNLKPVGGSREEITTFYRTTPVKDAGDRKSAQLNIGDSVSGQYAGTFVTKKYNTTFYKIRTEAGLVAVPGSGQLNSLMAKVAEGADVKITYNGKEEITRGPLAGKSAHSYFVAASALKAEGQQA